VRYCAETGQAGPLNEMNEEDLYNIQAELEECAYLLDEDMPFSEFESAFLNLPKDQQTLFALAAKQFSKNQGVAQDSTLIQNPEMVKNPTVIQSDKSSKYVYFCSDKSLTLQSLIDDQKKVGKNLQDMATPKGEQNINWEYAQAEFARLARNGELESNMLGGTTGNEWWRNHWVWIIGTSGVVVGTGMIALAAYFTYKKVKSRRNVSHV